MSKKGRWQTVSIMAVKIQIASNAQCWRIVTAKEKTEPIPNESVDAVRCGIGAGQKFHGYVCLRRKEDETFHHCAVCDSENE